MESVRCEAVTWMGALYDSWYVRGIGLVERFTRLG